MGEGGMGEGMVMEGGQWWLLTCVPKSMTNMAPSRFQTWAVVLMHGWSLGFVGGRFHVCAVASMHGWSFPCVGSCFPA